MDFASIGRFQTWPFRDARNDIELPEINSAVSFIRNYGFPWVRQSDPINGLDAYEVIYEGRRLYAVAKVAILLREGSDRYKQLFYESWPAEPKSMRESAPNWARIQRPEPYWLFPSPEGGSPNEIWPNAVDPRGSGRLLERLHAFVNEEVNKQIGGIGLGLSWDGVTGRAAHLEPSLRFRSLLQAAWFQFAKLLLTDSMGLSVCQNCHKPFTKSRRGQAFCSGRCRNNAAQASRRRRLRGDG
jgi:hypothetical protein